MKKIIITIVLLLGVVVNMYAQQTKRNATVKNINQTQKPLTKKKSIKIEDFKLEYDNGYRFIGTENNYVILYAPGYTNSELYSKMLIGLNDFYTDIDKVATKIDNHAITINATTKPGKTLLIPKKSNSSVYEIEEIHYRLSFKFKNDKVRIDLPIVKSLVGSDIIYKSRETIDLQLLILKDYIDILPTIQSIINQIIRSSYDTQNEDW